jgi:hypothetical protein
MFRLLIILAAAVAVPYLVKNGPNLDKIWPAGQKSAQITDAAAGGSVPGSSLVLGPSQGLGTAISPSSAPLEGMPSMSLHDVFRFDVSKEWVYQRWARKSTALAELGLFGIRVPLVTGTQMHDLAGSLTYYFGQNGYLQRISFTGRTGDTTQLVMLMSQRYGLRPQSTVVVGEQLLQERYEEHVFSELRTRPAPVLWANSPHDSYAVELELQRPGAKTPLPQRTLLGNSPLAEQVAATEVASETASGEGAAEKPADKSPGEAWNSYSPRSRVPKEQVENLDRRNRFW